MPIPLHDLLHHCKQTIEEKLTWGPSADWKQRDYECLSKLIFEETEISISLSTLRRLWKPNYAATPHPSTLEALAKFAGFEGWHQLQQEQLVVEDERSATETKTAPEANVEELVQVKVAVTQATPSTAAETNSEAARLETAPAQAPKFKVGGLTWLGSALAAGIAVLLLFTLFSHNPAGSNVAPPLPSIPFSHRTTVQTGLPNTVIFDFDLSQLNDQQVHIQQSWNQAERVQLNPSQKHHSAVYYLPGFHRARLLVDERIVADRRVHITTDDWLPLARYDIYDTIPFYLPVDKIRNNGVLHAAPQLLADARLDLSKNKYWVSYYNVRDFGAVTGDDFRLEARLRNRLEDGGLTCQKSQLFLLCENEFFLIPLAYAGCVSDMTLLLPDQRLTGKEHDMSAFGCDLSDWRTLTLTAKAGDTRILVDDRELHRHQSGVPAGRIKGMQFRFYGTGALDWVRLYDGQGQLIYADDFETAATTAALTNED